MHVVGAGVTSEATRTLSFCNTSSTNFQSESDHINFFHTTTNQVQSIQVKIIQVY